MLESCSVSDVIPASPKDVYEAYLSTDGHSAITGSPASVDGKIGGTFKAWDGYIWGTTLELEPHRRIVQAWHTSDFPDEAEDSRLEMLIEPAAGGSRVTFNHTDIPQGQSEDYRQGWVDFYLEPMKEFFGSQ
jgi:activator of HSP90 ATPase